MTTANKKVNLSLARVYVKSTFNNTILTLTDLRGNAIFSSSCGKSGFKNTKKGTPFAAKIATENLSNEAKTIGIRDLEVYLNGVGQGKEASLRALQSAGINIISIVDKTPVPHGGTKPKKIRRV
jgi:small subunit ribosomal protein S11